MNRMDDVMLEPSQKTVNGGHIWKMDEWTPMCTTEERCSLSDYLLTNTDLVLISGKPRCIDSNILNVIPIYVLIMYLCI